MERDSRIQRPLTSSRTTARCACKETHPRPTDRRTRNVATSSATRRDSSITIAPTQHQDTEETLCTGDSHGGDTRLIVTGEFTSTVTNAALSSVESLTDQLLAALDPLCSLFVRQGCMLSPLPLELVRFESCQTVLLNRLLLSGLSLLQPFPLMLVRNDLQHLL